MFVEIIVFFITFVVGYYVYVHMKIHRHFDKNGIKYVPGIPMFGNMLQTVMLKRHITHELDAVYKEFPEEKYVGYIEGTTPILLVRDPELVKNITVKDFDHFVNHKQFFTDTLFSESLFMMRDDKWRDMRTTLSPAFTGSKMRRMLPFIIEISDNIIKHLKDYQDKDIEVNDVMRRYTNDVIASTAFGIQVNSLKDRENDFYLTGQNLFQFTVLQRIYMFFSEQFPFMVKLLNIKVFPEKTTNFFNEIVSSTMEFRRKNNVERPDMIQLLMEATKGTLKSNEGETEKDNVGFATTEEMLKPRENIRKWTDTDLTAQVFIFFVAGFESSANTLAMCIHELALNPEEQEKLYQEVKSFKNTHGTLSIDNINELKYLDCVLNETQRKWAVAIMLDRVCSKSYQLPPPREGGKPYTMQPGEIMYYPVNSLHLDPKHFPDPEKFNPERFSEENRHKIKPFTFLPFGSGPRNCIGSRFAILQLKVMLFNMVLNYSILKCEATVDPIRLVTADFHMKVPGGTRVRLVTRN